MHLATACTQCRPVLLTGRTTAPVPTSRRTNRALHRRRYIPVHSSTTEGDEESGGIESARNKLNRAYSPERFSGGELRDLVYAKWQRSFDVRLQQRGNNMYLHVMWRFLEQKSFPLTDEEYQEQLNAVAAFVDAWGVADMVRQGIAGASRKGPGHTGGGGARAISIPLRISSDVLKSSEWNI
ncbi:CPLD11 [Auxenochlorella protothecoides x Auxenochlorella symbiontica]